MIFIEYSQDAIEDLENIFLEILKDKPSVAFEYTQKIEEFIELLQDNPMLGKRCKAKGIDADCRVMVFENYLILYRILNKRHIMIVSLINQKQNYNKGKK